MIYVRNQVSIVLFTIVYLIYEALIPTQQSNHICLRCSCMFLLIFCVCCVFLRISVYPCAFYVLFTYYVCFFVFLVHISAHLCVFFVHFRAFRVLFRLFVYLLRFDQSFLRDTLRARTHFERAANISFAKNDFLLQRFPQEKYVICFFVEEIFPFWKLLLFLSLDIHRVRSPLPPDTRPGSVLNTSGTQTHVQTFDNL